jgi:importin-7
MWQAFELIHRTFKQGAGLYLEGWRILFIPIHRRHLTLYAYFFQDMLPALDNYVQYGTDMMIQNPSYLAAIVGMVQDIFHDSKVSGVDRICGCKLAEAVMLNLRGHADQYVPIFIELAMATLTNDEAKVKSYKIHLMEVVINAIYYNAPMSLRVLEAKGWTNKFFSHWFSSIDLFKRVHDKTLSIAAISALLTLPARDVPASVQQGWPRLLQGVTRLFQTLPAAVKSQYLYAF